MWYLLFWTSFLISNQANCAYNPKDQAWRQVYIRCIRVVGWLAGWSVSKTLWSEVVPTVLLGLQGNFVNMIVMKFGYSWHTFHAAVFTFYGVTCPGSELFSQFFNAVINIKCRCSWHICFFCGSIHSLQLIVICAETCDYVCCRGI